MTRPLAENAPPILGLPVTAESLRKVYRQRGTGRRIVAIEDVTLRIGPGDIVAIVGRTGCGKSTFIKLLLGLEPPSGGDLHVGDLQPHADFKDLKGVIATVFQEDRLLPWRSAIDNAMIGLEILGHPADERRQRAVDWFDRLGLAGFEDAYPHELSGGMRQRVALARAFTIRPRLLLADEAFGHLDEVTAIELRKQFLTLVRMTKITTIVVTHQLDEALTVADRVVVFDRPARVIADLDCSRISEAERGALKTELQDAIGEGNGS